VVELDQQIADTRAALDRTTAQSSTEETTDVNPLRQVARSRASQSTGLRYGVACPRREPAADHRQLSPAAFGTQPSHGDRRSTAS
jgi:hypothetical protein